MLRGDKEDGKEQAMPSRQRKKQVEREQEGVR